LQQQDVTKIVDPNFALINANDQGFFLYSPVHSCYIGYIVCVSALKVIFVGREGRASREATRPLQHVGARIKALSKTRVRLSIRLLS